MLKNKEGQLTQHAVVPKRDVEKPLTPDSPEVNTFNSTKELQKYLETKGLTSDEISDFSNWFHRELNSRNQREEWLYQQQPDAQIKTPQKIETELIIELNHRIKEHLKEQQRTKEDLGEKRLIPFLLTKFSAEKKIREGLAGLKEKNDNDKNQQTIIVVANMDLDGLKQINDTKGHLIGDVALKFFGTKLNESLRPGPNVGGIHYSGDEFGIFIEMTLPTSLTEDEIHEKVQKRISYIVAQTCGAVLSNQERDPQIQEKQENLILGLYNRDTNISREERNKILDQHKKHLQKITNGTSVQQVSTGFIIAREQDNFSYEDVQTKADRAAELSKLLPYLTIVRSIYSQGSMSTDHSQDRVIDATYIDTILQNYDINDIEDAKLVRSLSRVSQEIAPNVSEQERIRFMLASPPLLKRYAAATDPIDKNICMEDLLAIERILNRS